MSRTWRWRWTRERNRSERLEFTVLLGCFDVVCGITFALLCFASGWSCMLWFGGSVQFSSDQFHSICACVLYLLVHTRYTLPFSSLPRSYVSLPSPPRSHDSSRRQYGTNAGIHRAYIIHVTFYPVRLGLLQQADGVCMSSVTVTITITFTMNAGVAVPRSPAPWNLPWQSVTCIQVLH